MRVKELINYCLSLHGATEDNQPDKKQTVILHSVNKKPFAYFFIKHDMYCVDLKCEPLRADFLRQMYSDVVPSYIRDKQNWNTIFIDGVIADTEQLDMIDHSYILTMPRLWANNKSIDEENKFWPKNFYYSVFKENLGTLPYNAECAVDYVLSQYKKREKSIVLAHYKDYKSYATIGREHLITGNRVSQIIHKALRKSRHPVRSKYLLNLTEEIDKEKIRKEIIRKNKVREKKTIDANTDFESIKTLTIIELNLSVRSYNCLTRAGIKPLFDLSNMTFNDLLKLRNLGGKSLQEIVDACKLYGIIIVEKDFDEVPTILLH